MKFLLLSQLFFMVALGRSVRDLRRYKNFNSKYERNPASSPSRYLKHFALLDRTASSNPHSREFQFAIQQIQKSANIVESGVLNPKTIEVLSAGRCGNPDGDFESNEIKFITSPKTLVKKNGSGEEIAGGKSRGKRFAVGGNRWDTHRLSFEVRNGPFTLSQGQVRRAFRKALGIWSSASGLNFIDNNRRKGKRARRSTSDLNIAFRRRNHECGHAKAFDGPGGELAHAFFPTAGQAHFDMDERWSTKDKNGFNNLIQVATHEIGHMLGLGHSDVHGSIMNAYYNDPKVEKDPRYQRAMQLNWDDIQSIQELYGAPKSSKSKKAEELASNMQGEYSAAMSLSPTRIMLIQGKYGITRLPGGTLTPKRLLSENFVGIKGNIVAATYNQVTNNFHFFNDKGIFFRFSGSLMDDRFPIQYRAANLPSIPNALWSKSNAIFAICNGAIYRAFDREKGRRITFRFYAKMKEKFPRSPSRIVGAFIDSKDGIYLIGPSNLAWRYENNDTENCYPKEITNSLMRC